LSEHVYSLTRHNRSLRPLRVQSPVRDLVDAQRVRLWRLMANPERDHSERDRPLGIADRDHHGAEAPRRPRDLRLHASAEPRTVAPLRLAGQQPLAR
jgi:hypothetical protein